LTYEEGKAIYEVYRNNSKRETSKIENIEVLSNLEKRIDKALIKYNNGAFIKLNTRSPKVKFKNKKGIIQF
jgi:hypothetical protein